MSPWQIRRFTYSPAEYDAQAALQKAINPASSVTVEKLKFWDRWWDETYRRAAFLVESAGQTVARGSYNEWLWWYEPGRYYVSLEVHPDFRNQGIGGALYDHLMRELAAERPRGTIFMTKCREDQPETVRFLTRRGFQENGRELYSALDLTTFDPQRAVAANEQMRQQGITILTYPELAVSDPQCQHKCFEMHSESMRESTREMPAGGENMRQSFEQYVQQIFENTAFIPEAFFVALDQGRYVGLSNLTNENDDPTRLTTDYTGVIPSHRRRGIASALKLRCLQYAKANGAKTVTTSNDATNPMYGLNINLGFTPMPAALYFELRVPAAEVDA